MLDKMKQIAISFHIKCDKYSKDKLTPELMDVLFREAFDEYVTMCDINGEFAEVEDIRENAS